MRIVLAFRLIAFPCLGIVAGQSAPFPDERVLATAALNKGDYAAAEQHARAALAQSGDQSDLDRDAVLTQLGSILQTRGECCEAETLIRQALSIREAHYGPDSIEVALGQHNLAAVWQQHGRLAEAAALQAKSLALAERLLPADSAQMVPFLTLAALTEREGRHYDRAEELLERARTLAEKTSTDRRPLFEVTRYLALLYRVAARFDDAERTYQTLIGLAESEYGPDALDTANANANMGATLCQRKYYKKAEPFLTRAVDTYQRIHETGPAFFTALGSLSTAELYLGQANLAEQHALLCLKTAKGDDDMATANNNLGEIYVREGRYKDAEQALTRAKDLWMGATGPDSSKTAVALSNLGALYVTQRKYKKAEALYTETARIDSKISGTTGLDYARDLNRLGVLYNSEKRFADADRVLREVIEIDSKRLAAESPLLAEPFINLAVSLHGLHRRDEALESFQRGIEIMRKAGQKNVPAMAVVLEQYSQLLREMERWADAEQATTEALGIVVRQKVNGEAYR